MARPHRLLLFSSSPEPDESFTGYLLRLTELNRLATLSWLLQAARIKSYVRSNLSFAFNPFLNLSPLAQLSGVDEDQIENLFYVPVNRSRSMGDYLVFGSAVLQYMVRVRQPKICPACLGEASYARKIWDLSPITACPAHRCLLLDECPNCSKRISWARAKISYCGCDFDWRNYEVQTINDSELRVSQQIHFLCKIQSAEGTVGGKAKDNPLYHINLKNFLSVLFFIASQYAGGIDTKGKHLAPSTRNAELHVLLCKAWAVFETWPNKYFNFLNWRRRQVPHSQSIRGLRRDYAEYKSALYKQLAVTELNFMRTAFEEYLLAHWHGGYTSHVKRLADAAHHESKYLSRREAKDLLRVGVVSIDNFIAIGKLKAIVRNQGNTRLILIERASLLKFKYQLDQSLYLKQVQVLLGLSHKRVLELVPCGLLSPLRGPTVDGCSDWRFSKKEAKSLLDKIKKKVRLRSAGETGGTISFLMALRKLRHAHISMGQFIKDIFSGEIYPCEVSSKPGLDAFQFSKRLITKYVCRLTSNRKDGETFR